MNEIWYSKKCNILRRSNLQCCKEPSTLRHYNCLCVKIQYNTLRWWNIGRINCSINDLEDFPERTHKKTWMIYINIAEVKTTRCNTEGPYRYLTDALCRCYAALFCAMEDCVHPNSCRGMVDRKGGIYLWLKTKFKPLSIILDVRIQHQTCNMYVSQILLG